MVGLVQTVLSIQRCISEDGLEVNAHGIFEVCVLRLIKDLCTRTQLRLVSKDTIEVCV